MSLPPTWHCYPNRGQTYADLLAEHGKPKMLVAVLHLPEPTLEDMQRMLRGQPTLEDMQRMLRGPSLWARFRKLFGGCPAST